MAATSPSIPCLYNNVQRQEGHTALLVYVYALSREIIPRGLWLTLPWVSVGRTGSITGKGDGITMSRLEQA